MPSIQSQAQKILHTIEIPRPHYANGGFNRHQLTNLIREGIRLGLEEGAKLAEGAERLEIDEIEGYSDTSGAWVTFKLNDARGTTFDVGTDAAHGLVEDIEDAIDEADRSYEETYG